MEICKKGQKNVWVTPELFIYIYYLYNGLSNHKCTGFNISVYYSNSYTDPQKSNWNEIMDIQDIPFYA